MPRLKQLIKVSSCAVGRHKWDLKKETSRFATNIRTYECACGKEKGTFQAWGSDKEITLK